MPSDAPLHSFMDVDWSRLPRPEDDGAARHLPGSRVPALPDVPTIVEAGLPEFGSLAGWHMLVAPGKTPRAVVEKLHAELIGILALPEIDGEVNRLGLISFDNPSVDGLQSFVKSEIARWGQVVQRAGIAGLE